MPPSSSKQQKLKRFKAFLDVCRPLEAHAVPSEAQEML